MNKDTKIYLVLVVIVLLIIAGIYYFKNMGKETPEEQTIACISKNAVMYSKTDCSHCKQQKQILGVYQERIKIIECDKETNLCIKEGITGTPTWKINGKLYPGVKSIKELADLSGCKCNANIEVTKNSSETCELNSNQQCAVHTDNICSS